MISAPATNLMKRGDTGHPASPGGKDRTTVAQVQLCRERCVGAAEGTVVNLLTGGRCVLCVGWSPQSESGNAVSVVMGIVLFGSRARKRERWCALCVVWEVMIGR
jgi:hypothetical protein